MPSLLGGLTRGLVRTEGAGLGGGYDAVAPLVLSRTPADEATGVSISGNLVATFNEPIQFAVSPSIEIRDAGGIIETLTSADIGTKLTISGSNLDLIINPTNDFATLTAINIRISATSIQDMAGNFFTGYLSAVDWNFETAASSSAGEMFGFPFPITKAA